MDVWTLTALNTAKRDRRGAVLVSDLAAGTSRLITEDQVPTGDLGQEIEVRLLSGKSGMVEIDGRSLFLNVHLPPPKIVVIGAVHISQALAPMAALAGFAVTIIDPRTAFATPERFAGIDLHADWPDDVFASMPLDRYSAMVAVTHDPKIDDPGLIAALNAGCFYVGALGSRKTHAKRIERLSAAGLNGEAIAGIRAPIGLDIGAATPAEIAVAILAEIIQSLRRRSLVSASIPQEANA
ncbi:XdhC/CoxF family protein [Rhizobium sp. TH135]|uniref:XdhC family protein n=1 Tax=Rhizobium sp. TH135 TaxID=2067451 RepID=UPI000C7D61A8|nr:XdhC family protein [Rhizobium sp. TH135]PLK71309.1 XdhC/CoxF family protein [Rhizobium sp. TH135]